MIVLCNLEVRLQNYIKYKIELENQTGDLGKIRKRKELAEARLKELSFRQKQEELISLDKIAKELEDIAIVVSNKLAGIPQFLKRENKISKKIEQDLERICQDILQELKDPQVYTLKFEQLQQKQKSEQALNEQMVQETKK